MNCKITIFPQAKGFSFDFSFEIVLHCRAFEKKIIASSLSFPWHRSFFLRKTSTKEKNSLDSLYEIFAIALTKAV